MSEVTEPLQHFRAIVTLTLLRVKGCMLAFWNSDNGTPGNLCSLYDCLFVAVPLVIRRAPHRSSVLD